MGEQTFAFQTEVGRLLDIVAHSLYSHKEIFLRELISNAADACDRLRYAALTDPHLVSEGQDFAIRIEIDKAARTLAIVDNGIGMDRQDLIDTLGTIARSGTQAFLAQLSGDAKKDLALIGQFGVGFYSAFMVAERVDVVTRRAGDSQAWLWTSDGKGSFRIAEAERAEQGTTVTLHLAEDEGDYLEAATIRRIVKTYSDHIGFPILLGSGSGAEKLNEASSLWTLPKKDITEEQYREFYRHVGHLYDRPWLTMHHTVEGVVSYTSLLFVPTTPPFDIFSGERKVRVRLYAKRVFITEDTEALVPEYLRFLRGVVDSEDLPLNISRETIQHDPRLRKIRSSLIKRVLDELAKRATESAAEYAEFWGHFGSILKEGLYEDFEHRDKLLTLVRFHSTRGDALVSLAEYAGRMRPGQDAIYYVTGEQVEALRHSPQLEGFTAKGVEVLLLTDPIDQFWMPLVGSYDGKPFRSVAGADADPSKIEGPAPEAAGGAAAETAPSGDVDALIGVLRSVLRDQVKDVKVSQRLTDSPVCLVTAAGDMDSHLERLLRQHRHLEPEQTPRRIFEINPCHPLIRHMAARAAKGNGAEEDLRDPAFLLLDQARIVEGDAITDPAAFARRLTLMIERGLPQADGPERQNETA